MNELIEEMLTLLGSIKKDGKLLHSEDAEVVMEDLVGAAEHLRDANDEIRLLMEERCG